MAGFRGPLFLLGISAQGERAGFRNPLPIPPLAGTEPTQAGFIGPIPLVNLGARPGAVSQGGPSDGAVRQPLQDDEEVIMLVARAFLTLVN